MKPITIAIVIATVFLIGACSDISGSGVADFGSTTEDKQVLEHFKGVYGDITSDGDPRILEPMLTTDIDEYLPVDKVLKYSSNTDNFYLWFVYDNFKEGDTIKIEWTYQDNGKIINVVETTATGDFGRGSFALEKPDDLPDGAWPLGSYTVEVSGNGASESADFEVISGSTVTTDLPWADLISEEKEATGNEPDEGNLKDTKTYPEIISNNNPSACQYTDTSTFSLPGDAYVSKIRMWYYWQPDETTLPFTLEYRGDEIISGVLFREGCDPYQTSWCEATYYPKKNMDAGEYTLTVETARLCQNSASKGNGLYIIYGELFMDEDSLIGTETASGFVVENLDCSFEGAWSSNWGHMEFQRNGDKVTGTYTHDSGKINAEITGNILIGTWSEYPSYKPKNDAGDVELQLSTDCQKFEGHWRYGSEGDWSGDWTGTKK